MGVSLSVMALSALACAMAAQEVGEEVDSSIMRGTAGVCIRWGADLSRVEEAVVVVSSGNPNLDASLPVSLPRWSWPRGDGQPGRWIGIWVSIGEAGVRRDPPDCSDLPAPPPRPQPPAPPAT